MAASPTPVDLSFDRIEGRSGLLSFATAPAAAERLFPHAARYLGANRIAALACCSSLVGMVVPGLHSLFRGLDLSLCGEGGCAPALEYSVKLTDARFRLVRIAVKGGGLSGFLDAFSRLPPVVQPTIAKLARSVTHGEFLGATALIIGGSRGLGELTAKLIAAGGGDVIVTYVNGKADALAVAGEIKEWGGQCETMAYDARKRAEPQLVLLRRRPTHLYYFATPTIFRRKTGIFSLARFEEFNAIYLAGFLELVEACLAIQTNGLCVFYPSTVAIDERPADMAEYAMSKAAGEILCADLQKSRRGLRIVARRLPRLPTDQTNSLVSMDTADPPSVMVPILREMHRAHPVPMALA